MKHALSALFALLLFGCSSSPLSADNASDAADALNPLTDTLEGITMYSVGVGQCWSGEGICAQAEAQTGADEASIREAIASALEGAGYTGPIEVRMFDENPRQPE